MGPNKAERSPQWSPGLALLLTPESHKVVEHVKCGVSHIVRSARR